MVTLMIYGILEYFFPGRILSREKILSSAYSIRYYRHSFVAMIVFGRILSREDFVLYLWNSMVSLIIYGILEYFFPREDFVPEEDFVLIIFSPLLLTLSYCNDWILKDFVPGGFYPREDFVLYLCNSMVSLMIYGILEYFFHREDFLPEGGFCPHHILSITTLYSVVVMIEFWRILSRGDFTLGKILSCTYATQWLAWWFMVY